MDASVPSSRTGWHAESPTDGGAGTGDPSRLEGPENLALFSFVSKMRQLIFVFAQGRI